MDERSKVNDGSEFWAAQKAKKYVAKELVERFAFDMDGGI